MDRKRSIADGMTLVWDVDDVLNALTREWFERTWLPGHLWGPVKAYWQLTANPPHDLLGVTKGEYIDSLDTFRTNFYKTLKPDTGLYAWMKREGHRFRHIALTAVPIHKASCSGEWIFRHWGSWIRTIHVVPSPRPGSEVPVWDKEKIDFLRWFGHSDVVLIEDNLVACQAAHQAGYLALLVPQPWNESSKEFATIAELVGQEFFPERKKH